MSTVTRFPPSPTGYLHVGGARTALFNWLYARKSGGEMVLRIEDTDLQRSSQEAIDVILEAMKWLGLTWNQGPFYQTKRFDRYGEIIKKLLEQGDAYYCRCSKERLEEVREKQRANGEKPRYDHYCRDSNHVMEEGLPAVIRFRNPLTGTVIFDDVVRGKVEIDNSEMDDLIIARTDGSPTYNLTVVVDDIDMGITHVIRGDDHTNNTPRQINIFHALKASLPTFAHVPLILGKDGQRLSKRHGAVSVLEYREIGILPEALLNYLIRLGWSHGDQEIFDQDEMIELFDISDINKSAASFDMEKLLWLNQHYIKAADQQRLAKVLAKRLNKRGIGLCGGPEANEVVEVLRDRVQTLEEMVDGALYLYQDFDEYDENAAKKHLRPVASDLLASLSEKLAAIDEWEADAINQSIEDLMAEKDVKLGKIAQPLRVAISGASATPPIDVTMKLVGKERALERISRALKFIEQRVQNNP
ncbi:MAG: glutamate--tRNA ligase [Gammaproteobacteria bacterium]|nr:glutamate--tRNA ligase [Gammaproteobacteria bacterium]